MQQRLHYQVSYHCAQLPPKCGACIRVMPREWQGRLYTVFDPLLQHWLEFASKSFPTL